MTPSRSRVDKVPARRARRRWPVVVLAAVAGFLAAEAIPAVPGHYQAALLGDLAVSDAGSVVGRIPLFRPGGSAQPCAALDSDFGVGNDLLKNAEIGWYASIWPSYHALTSFYVGSLLPGGAGCARDFERTVAAIDANYWDQSLRPSPPAFDQGPNRFHITSDLPRVDDSLWMALAIMDDYARTRDPALLQRARDVFQLAVANWDAREGGVYWEYHLKGASNDDKTVVSNAPAVVLGVELFAETGQHPYLAWSDRIMRWLEANLRNPRTGLYDDGVDDQARPPRLHSAVLTYNQGIVLGAMAALSRVDPVAYPLSGALQFAGRCETYFDLHHSYGQRAYDAIWAYNLLWVAGLADQTAVTGAARASVGHAVMAPPRDVSGLLERGSGVTLVQLSELPAGSYAELYPALSQT